jgi:hypothetical protein
MLGLHPSQGEVRPYYFCHHPGVIMKRSCTTFVVLALLALSFNAEALFAQRISRVPAVIEESHPAMRIAQVVRSGNSGGDRVASVLGVPVPYATIGAALAAAANGDTIDVAAGVFVENVVVNKSVTIRGAGASSTRVVPSFTDPAFPAAGTFPAGHSTLFLIQANDVTIELLTMDGDNPLLTGGYAVGGANIDARNAVVTDHTLGTFNNLTIREVHIVNIFWRALYASSGGTFRFTDNVIQNVQGSTSGSMGVFNWAGAGVIARDTIVDCLGAIVANHSRGMNVLSNVVVNSSDGIHSDNSGDGGGVPDSLVGNKVSDSPVSGYGIWVFVPYLPPYVADNTVTNVDYGLGAFGGAFGPTVTAQFIHNTVDGQGRSGSLGFYLTNTTFSYGVTDVAAFFSHNELKNNEYGLYIESASGKTVTMQGSGNAILNNTLIGVDSGAVPSVYGNPSGLPGTVVASLTGNWWGSSSGPYNSATNVAGTGNAIDDGFDYSPWWGGDYRSLPHPWAWHMNSSNGSTIQEAVDAAVATDVVNVTAGTYTEQIEIASNIVLTGAGAATTRIVSPVTLTKSFITSGTTHNYPVIYVHDADAVVNGFTIDGAGRGNANYRFVGVGFRNAGGTLSQCTIRDVRDTPIGGTQHGVAVYAFADNGIARSLALSADSVYDFQKTGIVVAGANLTASVNGNCVRGAGAISFTAQNGIQMSSGATGTISENRVEGIAYTPFSYVATGVLLYAAGGDVAVLKNIIDESMVGVYFINCQGNADSNTISNSIAGMGSTPYWWGMIVDPGVGVRRQPPVSAIDEPAGSNASGRQNPLLLTTGVHGNVLQGGGNGSGLEVDVYGTETLNCTATGNDMSGWIAGMVLYKDPGATLGGIAHENSLAGNAWGLVNQAGVLFDAKQNWWGHASGPLDAKSLPGTPNYNNPGGLGDTVSEYVDYKPWYLDAARTRLLFAGSVSADWNMISNPVTATNDSAVVLFPTLMNGFVYSFRNGPGYEQTATMANGEGYWGKFPADAPVSFDGEMRTSETINVVTGWNMIGSVSLPVDTAAIVCNPSGIRVSQWIGYSGSYTPVAALMPGSGYWVKTNAAGTVVLNGGALLLKSPVPPSNPLASLNRLTITDARGRSQNLYFGSDPRNAIHLPMYDMPPIPPVGAFDARFEQKGGGSMVGICQATGGNQLTIAIQSDAYPLVVRWSMIESGGEYMITDGRSGETFASVTMQGEGTFRVDNPEQARLVIQTNGTEEKPREFSLAQNYPNPFNPSTTIRYALPMDAHVTLRVFNVIGQEVATLVNADQKTGFRSVEWQPSSLASGVYFYRLDAGSFSQVKRLLLLK